LIVIPRIQNRNFLRKCARWSKIKKFSRVYQAMDHLRKQVGKHTVSLGSSYLAHRFAQHLGARGDVPERTERLFKGETKRKRLSLPMFTGEVR